MGNHFKTKLCKHCKSEIDTKATYCKYCKQGQGNKVAQAIILVFGIFALIFGLSLIFSPTFETASNIIGESNQNLLTLEKFNKIKTGMTYEQVVEIIGEEGTVLSETDLGYSEYNTKMYQWYGQGMIGANANFTFQNNKLVNKSQMGLE